MATSENTWIVSVRFRHPTQNRDIDVRLETEEYGHVDAVFTSVDAFEKILLPFYQGARRAEGEELRSRVEQQRQGDGCLVLHKYPCYGMVPDIDWNTLGTIRL